MADSSAKVKSSEAEQLRQKKARQLQRIKATHKTREALAADNGGPSGPCPMKTQVAHNQIALKDMSVSVQSVILRVTKCEERFRSLDFKIDSLFNELKTLKSNFSAMASELAELSRQCAQEEREARTVAMEKMEELVMAKYRNLSQMLNAENCDDRNARDLLANDVSRLADHIKDVKNALIQDISHLRGNLSSLQAKQHQEHLDFRELVTCEAATRERFIMAARSDFHLRVVEMKQFTEQGDAEIKQNLMANFTQATVLVEQTRQDIAADIENLIQDSKTRLTELNNRFAECEADRARKATELLSTMDMMARNIDAKITDVDQKLYTECLSRDREISRLREAMAAENLDRAQDESAIMQLLEDTLIAAEE